MLIGLSCWSGSSGLAWRLWINRRWYIISQRLKFDRLPNSILFIRRLFRWEYGCISIYLSVYLSVCLSIYIYIYIYIYNFKIIIFIPSQIPSVAKQSETCSNLISCPLTHICNHSLCTGIFPDRLKISVYSGHFPQPRCWPRCCFRRLELQGRQLRLKVLFGRLDIPAEVLM
jgi:hypothetical protein